MKYCAERGFYECAENYPWESNAEFWMVTDLYNQMRALNLIESEVMTRSGKHGISHQRWRRYPRATQANPSLQHPYQLRVGKVTHR